MLTTAQQKVKQALEELQANALFNQDTETLAPAPHSSRKKTIYLIIGLASIMVFFSLALIVIWAPNQAKVVSYLAKEQQFKRLSEKLLNDCLENPATNFNQAKREHTVLLKKATDLHAPSSLKYHKQDFLDVMEIHQDILHYLGTRNNRNSITVNKKLIELNVKQELAIASLLDVLDQEKIKYNINENGSVQYWFNSKAYQY